MNINFKLFNNIEPNKNLKELCLEKNTYEQAKSKYGTIWSVWECPLINTDFGQKLLSIFEYKPDNILLSKTGREGLPRHFDINKWAVFNIPIVGDFNKSPLIFLDDFDNIIESTTYNSGQNPILFNARVNHAVLPSSLDRIVLSICWKIPYQDVVAKLDKHSLVNNVNFNLFFLNLKK